MIQKPRVLIVDDDPEIVNVMAMYLEGFCQVTTTTRAEECFRYLKTKVFDLIVTDLIIPVISGKQIISMIREKSPLFPVVAISGFLYEIRFLSRDEAMAKIPKPVEEETLCSEVKRLFAIYGRQEKSVFCPDIRLITDADQRG